MIMIIIIVIIIITIIIIIIIIIIRLWDFTVQCDRKIEVRRPDIVFIDKKERKVVIIDVAIPGDDRVKDKELEKLEKYQLLKDEIAKVWRMRKDIVVPVVIGARMLREKINRNYTSISHIIILITFRRVRLTLH